MIDLAFARIVRIVAGVVVTIIGVAIIFVPLGASSANDGRERALVTRFLLHTRCKRDTSRSLPRNGPRPPGSDRPRADFPSMWQNGTDVERGRRAAGIMARDRLRPRSRRHPHFAAASLARSLARHGIRYRHEQTLGGCHVPRWRSPNGAWQQPALRGYADFMASERFRLALDRLQARGRARVVCLMCAEAHWRRCHRRLICDALLIRGWRVLHLGLELKPSYHELTPFAVIGSDQTLTYPPLEVAARG